MVTHATPPEATGPVSTERVATRAAPTRSRETLAEELRRRGTRGGVIQAHRAMVHVAVTPRLFANVVGLPILLTVANLLALPWIADRWGDLLRFLSAPLGFGPNVGTRVVGLGDLYALAIPYVTVSAEWPGRVALVVGVVVTLAVLAVSLVLPARFLPLAYALRALCGIQAVSQVYFTLATPPFAYRLPDYLIGFLSTGAAVVALLPLLLGVTFFMFQVALWRKLLLAAMLVGHMAVLFPLHVLVHAYLVRHLSLLVLPLLFLAFGLLVETFVFVAFYGWGASWSAAPAQSPRPGFIRRR